jgi:hypothetical protein
MPLPLINSYNSWSKLEEVWLGDVYPTSWYDHLPTQIKDSFYRLTEITQEDLSTIQQMIESFGVKVRRPTYKTIDQYIDSCTGQLVKPQICPRDQFVVLGNNLIGHKWQTTAWQLVLDEYSQQSDCQVITTDNPHLAGANVVRLGNSLIIDTNQPDAMIHDFLNDYKVKIINNGGHLDGCFAILKPELILASRYYSNYDETFPRWEKIYLNRPEFANHVSKKLSLPHSNGKWWIPATPSLNYNRSFSEHILKHAQDWIGNYTETYFELNCLVIDEHNVMMLGNNPVLEKTLYGHGINVHWAPFRTRSFWDGGLHCITVDIRRQSPKNAEYITFGKPI